MEIAHVSRSAIIDVTNGQEGERDNTLINKQWWDSTNKSSDTCKPVSYTHLDVYKRQNYKLVKKYYHFE